VAAGAGAGFAGRHVELLWDQRLSSMAEGTGPQTGDESGPREARLPPEFAAG